MNSIGVAVFHSSTVGALLALVGIDCVSSDSSKGSRANGADADAVAGASSALGEGDPEGNVELAAIVTTTNARAEATRR